MKKYGFINYITNIETGEVFNFENESERDNALAEFRKKEINAGLGEHAAHIFIAPIVTDTEKNLSEFEFDKMNFKF